MFLFRGSKIIFLLFSLIPLSFCIEESSILLLPFKTKGLQKDEEQDYFVEPYQSQNEDDWPYEPINQVFNSSQFINKWYYNGLYVLTTINKKSIESYLNMEHSKLSIEKCNLNRIYTPSRDKYYYKPLDSTSYTKKEENMGNDVFNFIGDLKFKTAVNIGQKGDGLNFYFNEKDNGKDLCGNFGFNIDTKLDKTNLINQLKKKNYINEYIWTLKYLLEDNGIIVIGAIPHYYDYDSYLMSQYCEMKAIQNQSPETAWSFKMDQIRIQPKRSNKVLLSDLKVDFLPDRGLIIGTDEYKKKLDNMAFDNLIRNKICFCEEASFNDIEKGTNEIYYVYYCNKDNFIGNKFTLDDTHYNTFPSLEFYIKESNMTFGLNKEHLFYEIYNRVYFLVVFKKSGYNNIWKLGEPFFSHFQITFDQERKIVSFYNPVLPRIKNDDYLKEKKEKNETVNNSGHKKTIIYIVLISLLLIIILGGLAYFLGKKLNENRKKRANELKDEDFEYSTSDSINSVESSQGKDILGFKKV